MDPHKDTQISAPKRRKSVLVVTPYYASHGGSIERVAGQLIKDLSATENFHFTWAASHCPPLAGSKAPTPSENQSLILLPMRAFNQLEQFLGLRWPLWARRSLLDLKRAVESVDCLWLHDTFSIGSWLAFRAARKRNKPILVTRHQGLARGINPLRRFWDWSLDKFLTRAILGKAQQATFTADGAAEFYYRHVGFTAPVKIIPNGVNRNIFHVPSTEQRTRLRARFALREKQPVLLFVGRFDSENNLPVIHEMAKLLPEWRFWLAGEGPINPERWFLPNLQVFRGRRDEALAELYQAADMLILPSLRPSFPLAAQEAMACGLPVMCSPHVAAGSSCAKPYLWIVETDTYSTRKTAALWVRKLKAGKSLLPLAEAKTELSELAREFWEWPEIAWHYADTINTLCHKRVS